MTSPRTALVTGAGSGMGRLAAQRLAAAGADVAALDINKVGLDETASAAPDRIRAFPCDVADADAVTDVVDRVIAELGPLDRVLNAAGLARVGGTLDLGADVIMQMMAVNYGGTVNVCNATLPAMLARGSGQLVNFASLAGWIPSKRLTAYCATKFAVVCYTEGLALEYGGRGVGITCLCPPAVKTPMLGDFFPEQKQKRTMAITPEKVLDALEEGIADGRLFVFPDTNAKVLWRLRRHLPRLTSRITGLRYLDLAHQ